jgi:hypothetical protein
MDHREFRSRFHVEARRLRLNMLRLPGLAASGTGWEEKLLTHMRGLEPGCTWTDVFPDVHLSEPPLEARDDIAANDADPEIYWRFVELHEALWNEMKRVLPAEIEAAERAGSGFGMANPHGPEHALRVFRSLPDGAGAKVAWTALNSTPAES